MSYIPQGIWNPLEIFTAEDKPAYPKPWTEQRKPAPSAPAASKESTTEKIRDFFGTVFGTKPTTSTTSPPAAPAYTPPSATPSATPSWLLPVGLGVGALALALIITRRKQ